jgi:hypothetical protein
MFAGKQAAHTWRRLEEIPKCLLPKISRAGIINPINAPATYHGHGCFKKSDMNKIFTKMKFYNLVKCD